VNLVTEPTGNIGRHIGSHLLHTGAAVRASTRGLDSASKLGRVVDVREQRIDPATSQQIALELAA
jgi:uncharacterized protein YbjT (DUF2867 family)